MSNIFKKLAGLFRPKPDAMEVALNIIPTALQIQLSLADPSKTSAASILKDNFALGYIFGYHDAVLQRLKVDNQTTCIAIMAVSYDTIFDGVDKAAPLFRKSLDIQNDEMFRKGMMKGGSEAVAFFREEKIPFGLSEWLTR